MIFRILPVLVAILACTLWPQGVVLCMGDEGHLEVELAGAGCCPSEPDEDCVDCADFTSPEQQSSPPGVILAPLSPSILSLLPDDRFPEDPSASRTPLLPPRESLLEGVILLV